MTDECDKLIMSANGAAEAASKSIDACMLQSMASCFRHGFDFPYNGEDMADLCERMAVMVATTEKLMARLGARHKVERKRK